MAALNRNPEQIFGLKEVENAGNFFWVAIAGKLKV